MTPSSISRTVKRDHRPSWSMKSVSLLLSTLLLLALVSGSTAAAGAEGGSDVNPGDEAPFTVLERTTPSQDGTDWSLSVELEQEAKDNGTTIVITTQICLNSGVCDPPVAHEANGESGVYTMSLTPPEDHSYVNWRVKATYADDSTENFPDADWYKTWSTCYYDDGGYGGIHAEGDGCNVPAGEEPEASVLPAVSLGIAVISIGFAAVFIVAKGAREQS